MFSENQILVRITLSDNAFISSENQILILPCEIGALKSQNPSKFALNESWQLQNLTYLLHKSSLLATSSKSQDNKQVSSSLRRLISSSLFPVVGDSIRSEVGDFDLALSIPRYALIGEHFRFRLKTT
ncbi:unnamed protein product [Microthlaspi erraticum]|uniref:Uncharacterized protein n=1 Tax=Microthlaspi erraticum TaxID=1685480 RepID=A0A6D2IE27_9BRAS|nr:unnamed protein product [Microthlaspi erraticum]